MSYRIDDVKLLQNYKAIWTKIKNLKNIELNALSFSDDRYMKTKIRTYGDKIDKIFHHWFFNHGFKFQDYICNECHDLTC